MQAMYGHAHAEPRGHQVTADLLRRAAARAQELADGATDGGFGWRLTDLPGANEVWADRDAAGHDAFMVASTATRLNPNPGVTGHAAAALIAACDPPFLRAVGEWLDTAGADLWAHGPLCDCGSGCHECDDSLWQPHVRRALAVARALLGES